MGLPARGDPRRPLQLAVRSTRLLAGLFLMLGTCAISTMLIRGGPMRRGAALDLGVLLIYVGPGALYLIVSMYLQRRRFWAVVVGLVLASIQLFFTVGGAAMLLFAVVRGASISIIPIVLVVFVMLALGQLIYHLALSFEAIKYEPPGQNPHGFEPLVAQPPEEYPGKEER
jgi:hypothetical protein